MLDSKNTNAYIHTMAKQLTVRGVTPELADALERLSEERSESVNATVLHILKQALGVNERRTRLERYATWNEQDAQEFENALRAQRVVDEGQWE